MTTRHVGAPGGWAAIIGLGIAIIVAPTTGAMVARPRPQLPNLAPLRPFHVVVAESDDGKAEALRFSFAVANRGEWPLDLESKPVETDTSRAEAWQCVAWITTRGCIERRHVGTLRWHESHSHFHYDDFAEYELRRLVDGVVDWSPQAIVAASRKVSYCLTNGPRDRRSSSDPLGPNPAYVCGNWIGLQGISPGYVDIYDWELPGQFVPISSVPNGRYALTVTVNKNRTLSESDRSDNSRGVGIQLEGDPGDRRISTFRLRW